MTKLLKFAAGIALLLSPLALLSATTTPALAASAPCTTGPGGYSEATLPGPGLSVIYNATSRARASLNLVMYELSDQKELNLLVGAAKRGVKVRVVLDRDYSGYSVNLPAYNFLRAHRVLVAWGPQNTIVHQKTLTVDGSCAIISTGNLTPQYYATTRDYVVTDTNKAEVAAINTTFSSDFSGRPITSATTSGNLLYSPGSESTLVSLISSATKSVYFESEELSDSYIVTTLSNAARRGVTCDILMTADSEWDSAFATLKASGCSVHLYPNTATGLYIHAKAIVVDANTPSAKIFVGSENASVASLIYNRELGLVLSASSAPRVVLAVTSIFTKDFTSAPERY